MVNSYTPSTVLSEGQSLHTFIANQVNSKFKLILEDTIVNEVNEFISSAEEIHHNDNYEDDFDLDASIDKEHLNAEDDEFNLDAKKEKETRLLKYCCLC